MPAAPKASSSNSTRRRGRPTTASRTTTQSPEGQGVEEDTDTAPLVDDIHRFDIRFV